MSEKALVSGVYTIRKKPALVHAMQWPGTAAEATPIIDWILQNDGTANYWADGAKYADPECPNRQEHGRVHNYCPLCNFTTAPEHIAIDTLEGTMRASAGDWIIRGVQGEFYPCKPDIFVQTYDIVGLED